jgi:hypothetical protein
VNRFPFFANKKTEVPQEASMEDFRVFKKCLPVFATFIINMMETAAGILYNLK